MPSENQFLHRFQEFPAIHTQDGRVEGLIIVKEFCRRRLFYVRSTRSSERPSMTATMMHLRIGRLEHYTNFGLI